MRKSMGVSVTCIIFSIAVAAFNGQVKAEENKAPVAQDSGTAVVASSQTITVDSKKHLEGLLEPAKTSDLTKPTKGDIQVMQGLTANITFGFWGPFSDRPGQPQKTVELDTSTGFGVTIDFFEENNLNGEFDFKLVMILPEAPITWGEYEKVVHMYKTADAYVENSDRVFVFTDRVKYEKGIRYCGEQSRGIIYIPDSYPPVTWHFADGDPLGIWEMLVFINGSLVKNIAFEVTPPKQDNDRIVPIDLQKSAPVLIEIQK